MGRISRIRKRIIKNLKFRTGVVRPIVKSQVKPPTIITRNPNITKFVVTDVGVRPSSSPRGGGSSGGSSRGGSSRNQRRNIPPARTTTTIVPKLQVKPKPISRTPSRPRKKLRRKLRIPKNRVVRRKRFKRVSSSQKPLQEVFNVFGKSKDKFIKLNIKPLTRKDALSKGAFVIDKTTASIFKIEPAGKRRNPAKLSKLQINYFNRKGFRFKKIVKGNGTKFKLKSKFVGKKPKRKIIKRRKGGKK